MISNSENPTITSFLLDYSDNLLSKAELKSFESLMDFTPDLKKEALNGKNIRKALRKLPQVKVRDGFDQRMAARFAMELEREAVEQNRSRIGDNDLTLI